MGSKSGVDGAIDVVLINTSGAAYNASGGGGGGGNAAAGATGSAVPADADYLGFSVGGTLTGVSATNPLPASISTNYTTPDGRQVVVESNASILFSDDFGGAAVDTTVRWDVIDGGLPANPTLHGKSLTQSAIGSGVTGMTDAVSGSALTVTMGTTASAERWYLSQQAFAGAEDLMFILQKSQALAANSIWIGLVEVDPTTLIPLYNAGAPSYTINGQTVPAYFTNAGGAELGLQTTGTAYASCAIGDSSSTAAAGSTATALQTLVATNNEFMVEFHAEDVIVSNGTPDSIVAKNTTPSRVSTQVPNDGKVYKLLMRFRNVGTPGSSTTVSIARILLWNSQEMRVEVTSGRGDSNPQKALAVNIAGGSLPAGSATIGAVTISGTPITFSPYAPNNSVGETFMTAPFLNATGTPAPQPIKAGAGRVYSGQAWNNSASPAWLKIFNAAYGSVTLGTTSPVANIMVPANSVVNLADVFGMYGMYCATAISCALTGGGALLDTTAIGTAGVVGVMIGYA
jgi:hypothetical protein